MLVFLHERKKYFSKGKQAVSRQLKREKNHRGTVSVERMKDEKKQKNKKIKYLNR